MTDILLKHPEVAQVFGSIGTPSSGRAGQGGAAGEVNKASLYVMLKPKAERKLSQQQFEDLVRPELVKVPGVRATFSATMGLGGKVQITLVGNDENDLRQTSERLTTEMRTVPGLFDVSSSAACGDLRFKLLRIPPLLPIKESLCSKLPALPPWQLLVITVPAWPSLTFLIVRLAFSFRLIPSYRQDLESIGNLARYGHEQVYSLAPSG
jgi:hypothetical protein